MKIGKRLRYFFYKLTNRKYEINVLNNSKTLDKILDTGCSVIRFGDGEFDIIRGEDIPYQKYNSILAERMKDLILSGSSSDLLICLPDIFSDLDRYTYDCRYFYETNFFDKNDKFLKEIESKKQQYYSTFLSRPYIDLKDKKNVNKYFEKMKKIWRNKDLLIVEGKYSRSGENNDLFNGASSISRIICPSKNAFSKINIIEREILKYGNNKVVLFMLGPTSKIIISDLVDKENYQLIDIGHIDSEYEWMKMGAMQKVKIPHKHTAEFNYDDDNIILDRDPKFNKQILSIID